MYRYVVTLLLILGLLPPPIVADDAPIIRLATITSTENSGLLPAFEAQTGYRIHVIAVGTGKALRMGRDGDGDVVLVHAPNAEHTFVEKGAGLSRHPVMHNDFLLVEPADDPAGIHPSGTWYREAGQGMGKVLQMANELDAWLAYRNRSVLQPLLSGDERLQNPYSTIAINPERYPDINHRGALALIDWLTGQDGQQQIASYRLHDEQLFHPDATKLARP